MFEEKTFRVIIKTIIFILLVGKFRPSRENIFIYLLLFPHKHSVL